MRVSIKTPPKLFQNLVDSSQQAKDWYTNFALESLQQEIRLSIGSSEGDWYIGDDEIQYEKITILESRVELIEHYLGGTPLLYLKARYEFKGNTRQDLHIDLPYRFPLVDAEWNYLLGELNIKAGGFDKKGKPTDRVLSWSLVAEDPKFNSWISDTLDKNNIKKAVTPLLMKIFGSSNHKDILLVLKQPKHLIDLVLTSKITMNPAKVSPQDKKSLDKLLAIAGTDPAQALELAEALGWTGNLVQRVPLFKKITAIVPMYRKNKAIVSIHKR